MSLEQNTSQVAQVTNDLDDKSHLESKPDNNHIQNCPLDLIIDTSELASKCHEVVGADVDDDDESNKKKDGELDDTNLEQSYEILSNSYKNLTMEQTTTTTQSGDSSTDKDILLDQSSQSSIQYGEATPKNEKIPSGSTNRKNSLQSSIKKSSSSFLSKLQYSSSSSSTGNEASTNHNNNNNHSSNLPSSFANAISSISSSFTSSFNLGSSSNGNTLSINNTNNNNNNNTSTIANLTIETGSTNTSFSQISETREQILNKKATLERKNLISLTKLIVKDLISSSLAVNRTIDECHSAIHLNNYFTLIDRVLKHGLKQNLLSNKSASLWSALDNLPKYLSDKRLTSETVRSLAHTKTPDGKIKAWLRIAMMQKKLPEYFNELLANKNVLLADIYHDFAFMMNEESHVFAGLIIGVNVIDCNFFVKDDNFDTMDEVIDLSPYLKAANNFDEDSIQAHDELAKVDSEGASDNKMTAVLDQKNYLEERSKHLESTIVGLQNRIKQLEEQNSRFEIDAKVNEIRIQKLQQTNSSGGGDRSSPSGFQISETLKGLMNPSSDSSTSKSIPTTDSAPPSSPLVDNPRAEIATNPPKPNLLDDNLQKVSAISTTATTGQLASPQALEQMGESDREVQKRLADELDRYQKQTCEQERELGGLRERVGILETSYRGALEKIRVLERDLDVQTSMNKDKETTIKIYEKDLREKQAQVESLRTSLADAKKINSDLSERLNDTSAKLKDRLNSITSLQTSLDKWKLENKSLATRLQDKQMAMKSVQGELEKSLKSMDDLKKYNERINDELRKERECGQSSSITVEAQTTKITELMDKLRVIERELEELRPQRDQLSELKTKCREYEQSLEEVGYQLRESRLEVESLKENSSVFLDSQWMDSKQVKNCALCQLVFSVTRRKHHCRLCGNVFCQTCSDNKMELASSSKPARVCDTCHAFLLAKFVKSSSAAASAASTDA